MVVVVRKEFPITLTGPVDMKDIILSDNDVMEEFPLAMMYIYKNSGNMKFSLLCDSLQKTLQFYPALCGRLQKNTTGSFDIKCTGNGAQIIKATSDTNLCDLNLNCLHLLPTDIHTNVNVSNPEESPTSIFQVTYWNCGAISISISIFHYILDGCAAFEFMNNWASIHRKEKILIFPVERRDLLTSDGSNPTMEHPEFKIQPNPSLEPLEEEPATVEDTEISNPEEPVEARLFYFSRENLDKLKDDALSDPLDVPWISTNDALCGLIWQKILQVRKQNRNLLHSMAMACNGRERADPILPKGYFGNANFLICKENTVGRIVSMNLSELAQTVRLAVNEINAEKIRSSINFVNSAGNRSRITFGFTKAQDIIFSSWNNFCAYHVNFGSGIPIYVGLPPFTYNGFVQLVDTPEQDGSLFVTIHLFASHMALFLQDDTINKYLTND